MNTQQQPQSVFMGKQDENILVVKRSILFPQDAFQGIKAFESSEWVTTILEKKEFLPRSLMETDPTYKQIIPYLVFMHENKLFLMQRQTKASETRLQGKFTLGIGGHIREEDMSENDISTWARREFHEEVIYNDEFTIEPLGMINDDSNDVGKVHIGFVYILRGKTPQISVQEELQSGVLLTLEECADFYDRMETWSQMVFDVLRTAQ